MSCVFSAGEVGFELLSFLGGRGTEFRFGFGF